MRNVNRILYSLIVVLMFFSFTSAQKRRDLEKYKLRTLSDILVINSETTDDILRKTKLEDKSDFISFDLFYSRVRVEFTGKNRSLSTDHKDLIKTWSKLQRTGEKTIKLYEDEFLFKENGSEYWIPVQKKVGDAMLQELKPDDIITLFVIHVGGRKAAMSREYDWLFLSIQFVK